MSCECDECGYMFGEEDACTHDPLKGCGFCDDCSLTYCFTEDDKEWYEFDDADEDVSVEQDGTVRLKPTDADECESDRIVRPESNNVNNGRYV